MKRLNELPVNSRARIAGFDEGSISYRTKLYSMGLTQGSEIFIARTAPFGDPVEVEIRGSMTSLRKREASCILVEEVKS